MKTQFFIGLLCLSVLGAPLFGAQAALWVHHPQQKLAAQVTDLGSSSLVTLLNSETQAVISQFEVPGVKPEYVVFGPQNQLLVGSKTRLVTYNISVLKAPIKKLDYQSPPEEQIVSPHFAPDGATLYWGEEKTLWSIKPQALEPAVVTKTQGQITDIAPMVGGRVVLTQAPAGGLALYGFGGSPKLRRSLGELGTVGVESPEGKELFGLSGQGHPRLWQADGAVLRKEGKLKVLNEWKLPQTDPPLSLQSNDLKTKLLVVFAQNHQVQVSSYRVSALQQGHADAYPESRVRTESGAVYQGLNQPSPLVSHRPPPRHRQAEAPAPSPPPKNSLYQLAKIEADNLDYNAALEYIHQVPTSDPEYRQSRELQKKVYRWVENQQAFNTAKEEFDSGAYPSAEILLKDLLDKSPNYKPAKKLLKRVEKRKTSLILERGFWFLLALAGLSGIVFLYRRRAPKKDQASRGFVFRKMDGEQRHRLLNLIHKTEQLLVLRRKQDKMGYYHQKFVLIEGKLSQAKTDLTQDKAAFDPLFVLVSRLHQELLELGKGRAKTQPSGQQASAQQTGPTEAKKKASQGSRPGDDSRKAEPENDPGSSSAKKEKKQKTTSQPPQAETPDWYGLLGVSPQASLQEIKQAYRSKIKEYHPDKHDSSDFKWVKAEAERMTRLVGQAYECLLNPSTRNQYDQSYKKG